MSITTLTEIIKPAEIRKGFVIQKRIGGYGEVTKVERFGEHYYVTFADGYRCKYHQYVTLNHKRDVTT